MDAKLKISNGMEKCKKAVKIKILVLRMWFQKFFRAKSETKFKIFSSIVKNFHIFPFSEKFREDYPKICEETESFSLSNCNGNLSWDPCIQNRTTNDSVTDHGKSWSFLITRIFDVGISVLGSGEKGK